MSKLDLTSSAFDGILDLGTVRKKEACRPIAVVDKYGVIVRVFSSMKIASEALNMEYSKVRRLYGQKKKFLDGMIFRHVDDLKGDQKVSKKELALSLLTRVPITEEEYEEIILFLQEKEHSNQILPSGLDEVL